MSDVDNMVTAVRQEPEFAGMNFADQYETQKKAVAQGYFQNPDFREAPEEYQKQAIDLKMQETFRPVYENPESDQWVNTLKAGYLSGDEQSRQALKIFYEKTELSDNLPFLTSLLNQIPDPETAYKYSGMPSVYQNGPMALNRTQGGDDNKARKEIEQLFLESGDQEMIDMLTDKSRRRQIIGTQIAEEALVALAATLTGGLVGGAVKGASVGAKALQTGGRIGAWIATNTPQLAVEAGIEGLRGMGETISKMIRYGEEPTVEGALMAFGGHAALDMAIGHVAGVALDGIRAVKAGYNTEIAEQVVNLYGKRVADGSMNVNDIVLPSGMNEDQFRHLASINMTERSYEKLAKKVAPSDLTELEQANMRAYNQGWDLTANADGTVFVQPKIKPSDGRTFQNTLRAEEWVGSQGSRYLDALVEAGDVKGVTSFVARNPQLNYHFARKWADDTWTVKSTGKEFVQPSARQFISPVEMSKIVDEADGQFIRFNYNLPEDQTKQIFVGNETVNVLPANEGNAVAFIGGEHKIATPNDIQIAQSNALVKMKDASMGKATVDEIVRDELVRQGFTGSRKADGSFDIFFPDRIKIADTRVNPSTGKIGTKEFGANRAPKMDTTFNVNVGIDASEIAAKPKQFAELGAKVLTGEVQPKLVRRYADSYLKASGVDKRIKIVRNNKGVTKVTTSQSGDVTIQIPKEITDLQVQKETFNKLMRGLDEVVGKKNPGRSKVASYTKQFKTHQKNYTGSFYSIKDFDAYVGSLNDLNSLTSLRKLKDGTYSLRSSITKKVYHASTANELMRDIAVNEMDSISFKSALERVGYKVEIGEGNLITVFEPGAKVPLASSIDQVELSKSIDFYPQKLPSSMAPALNYVIEVPTLNLAASKNLASGTAPDLSAFMGNFEDYRKVLGAEIKIKKANGDALLKMGKAHYEVKIKKLNYTKTFQSEAEAKKFLDGEWKTLASAQDAAQEKGLRVIYENGKFRLRKGNTEIIAKNLDDLQDQIAKYPAPSYANEIIPPDIRQALDELDIEFELPPGFGKASMGGYEMAKIKNKDWTILRDTTPGVIDKIMPQVAALRRVGFRIEKGVGKKLGLNVLFERLHKDSKLALNRSFRDKDALFNLFKEPGSKNLVSFEKRRGITHYIEAGASENPDLKKVIGDFDLNDKDIAIADKLMQFYKVKADEFGIPLDEMITNYQPRMRAISAGTKEATISELTTKDLLSSMPKTQQFMNKKGFESFSTTFERATDARKAWADEDALSVALRYVHNAHVKSSAGKSWDDMFEALKANKDDVLGHGYVSLLNNYKDALTHPQNAIHKSSAVKSMNGMAKKLGFSDTGGKEFVDLLMSLPYMTSMAFRPWMPFRNMFQIFTILPLRTGNLHSSAKAAKNLMKNWGGTLDEMLAEGIIPKRSGAMALEYQEMLRGNILENKGAIRNFYDTAMQKGLHWYGLSDDFTRGVAYLASKDMFNKGLEKAMVTGKLDEEVFKKFSRLDGLHPATQELVLDFLRQGNVRAAETQMARANIEATMFDYTALNKPLAASGTMGQLFYQFGTYSFNYVQLVGTSLRYGSKSNKIKGAIAMAAGMGIVAGGMKEAGIDNSSFLGYNMAMFNGGPFAGMVIDGIESMNPGIRGDVARRDLLRSIGIKYNKDGIALTYPSLAPGYMQVKYGMKFKQAIEDGDYWGAWLAFTTTPENKSRNE